ncbi:MAG: alpha/beta hydrolase [Candidatus Thorarchaeota archaeon]
MIRSRYLVLILTITLMLSGVVLAASIQNNMGSVIVTEVDFQAVDGSNIHNTLQRPSYATASNPLPGVIVYHGALQNKEWVMAFGIELARRGFVVLTSDANGHGNSDFGSGSGLATIEYLSSLNYVDSSSIGLIGHSMGGGTLRDALESTSATVRAVVLVGSWVGTDWNATYPSNLLVTVGDFDSLFSGYNESVIQDVFNSSSVEEYTTYGDFDSGTARKIVFARTNHLFETIDPEIVSETVEWMKESLKRGVEDENWIASGDLVYGWWMVGGFFATLGAILTIFPLITILLELPQFKSLERKTNKTLAPANGPRTKWGLIYSLIPPILFFPLLLVGVAVPFPMSYAASISSWLLGTALVLYLLLRVVSRKQGMDMSSFWRIGGDQEGRRIPLLKTFAVSALVMAWLYVWTLLVDLGFALDFRCFLPGLNDLTISRALLFPIFVVVYFLNSLIDGMWLMGPLRPSDSEPWYKGQTKWSLISIFLKCWPLVLLLGIEFGVGMLTGIPIIPGAIGFTFLFFYAFTPWMAVSAVITVWAFRATDQYYFGAILNGILNGWITASILSFNAGVLIFML